LIDYDDVDGFRDFWTFGGPDALLSTEYPNSGQFTYHLQNGNGTSSSILSSAFSIPREGELEVSFVFTPVSLERTEFLALEVSLNKGLTYVPYNSWISGSFVNGEQYQETATIAFQEAEADVRIRFTSYANSQYDHFYIDDIKIEFCSDSENAQAANQVEIEEEKARENDGFIANENGEGNFSQETETIPYHVNNLDMGFFPNPSHDEIRFSMSDVYQTDKSISVMQKAYRV